MVRKKIFLFLVLPVIVLSPLAAVLADTATVAVVPFRMNAEEPVGYIGDGVRDMLASRIGSAPSVSVVKQGLVREALKKGGVSKLTQENALEVGRRLKADYVVFGSISKIGNNVSVDVNLLTVGEGGMLSSVFAQSLGLDEVVPQMNVLARGITDAIAAADKTPPVKPPLAEIPSGGSSPPAAPLAETTGTQPLEDVGALFKKKPGADDVSDDGEHEFEFEEAGQLFETDKQVSPDVSGDGETGPESPEPADPAEPEQETITEQLFKRKSPVDPTDENPAYQKSIEDLQHSPESDSGETAE